MSDVQITTLPNGVRVVSDEMPTVESVSIGMWVRAGARFEAPEVNGVAHLLEHMMFKGTPRRTSQQIAETIESVGGHINAYTAREVTAYYAKVLKDDAGLAIDVIADF
ncbi:MAG: insulinase family protein, partial [Rhodospirillaceae bacterium]|nr:insulinase family protein [Rhodospirillaceae bacterium]